MKRIGIASFAVFGSLLLRYLFSSEEVRTGLKYSRSGLSFNNLIFFSIATFLFAAIAVTYSRIILRLSVTESDKTLCVHYIERFRIKPKIITVPLSKVQISKYIYHDTRTEKDYHLLSLTSKALGTLNINEFDFKEIKIVVDYFENMKLLTADRIRKKRFEKNKFLRRY